VTLAAGTGAAWLGFIDSLVAKVREGREAFVRLDNDVAAAAAITAVRSAARRELLATKTRRTVSTSTRDYVYFC
jgi:hypothetical protein